MISRKLIAWKEGAHNIVIPNSGYNVFCKDLGDTTAKANRTILLLHGFPESSYSYHKVVDGLLEQFDRLLVFDMVGYGFSDKPETGFSYSLIQQADIALQVWRARGITGGHILSHDMGTSVLTELLSRQVDDLLPGWFSDGFQSYTFTNGSMALDFAKLRVIQKLLLSRLGPLISQISNEKTFISSVQSAHGVSNSEEGALSQEDLNDIWQNMTFQEGHRKNHLIIRYLNDRKRFEKTRWLPALTAAGKTSPVHICWGDADNVAQIEMAHYLKNEVCPQAALSIMPGVGHFCQLGSPQSWLKYVGAFYQELDKSSVARVAASHAVK